MEPGRLNIAPGALRALPRRGRGFTLLEILVVVFIIGVIATLAMLSVDNRAADDRLQREARRLHALLETAGEEAVLFGVELGFEVVPDGYRFLRLDADGWTPVDAGDSPLRPRTLAGGVTLRLIREGEERRLAGDEDEDGGPNPDVLFLSSGEITPFELSLTASGTTTRYRYEGGLTGELKMTRVAGDHS